MAVGESQLSSHAGPAFAAEVEVPLSHGGLVTLGRSGGKSITDISSAPQEWSRGATASLPFPACTLKIGQGIVIPEVMLVGMEV